MPRGKTRHVTNIEDVQKSNVFYSRYREFRLFLNLRRDLPEGSVNVMVGNGESKEDDFPFISVIFSNSRAVVNDPAIVELLCKHPNFGGTAPGFEDAQSGEPLFWRGGYPDWYIEKIRQSEEGLAATPEAHGEPDFVI